MYMISCIFISNSHSINDVIVHGNIIMYINNVVYSLIHTCTITSDIQELGFVVVVGIEVLNRLGEKVVEKDRIEDLVMCVGGSCVHMCKIVHGILCGPGVCMSGTYCVLYMCISF